MIVPRSRVHAEVPDGLIHLRGGEYLNQRVLAHGQRRLRRNLQPVLAGKRLNRGGNDVLVLRDRACAADVNRAEDADGVALIGANDGEWECGLKTRNPKRETRNSAYSILLQPAPGSS